MWQEEVHADRNADECTKGVVRETTTGKVLDPKKLKAGRQEELDWMQKMHGRDRVPRAEATQKGDGNIVGTRWVCGQGRPGQVSPCGLSSQEVRSGRICTPVLPRCRQLAISCPTRPQGVVEPGSARAGG